MPNTFYTQFKGSFMFYRVFLFVLSSIFCFHASLFSFDKVVIWGHKLHSHTHSYIHHAFYRAFKHLGYEVYHFDHSDHLEGFDFSNTLFLTEGQVDQYIPLREDCFYILHNCDSKKYDHLKSLKKCIRLQVYTDQINGKGVTAIEVAPCIFENISRRTLYMPWATDLLPHEIDPSKKPPLINPAQNNTIYWIGTIGEGHFGNQSELNPFIQESQKAGIHFVHRQSLHPEEAEHLVKRSYIAPTIVGAWQKEVGYIPCRIFKNCSYGLMGVTNSYRVYELFNKKIVYDPDPAVLFHKAKEALKVFGDKEREELMNFVKDNHTYVNRIHSILNFIEKLEK
jgi:hypothetical protein